MQEYLMPQNYVATEVIDKVLEIGLAPLNHSGLFEALLPLILGMLVIELYFGRYEDEELGWNTSVGNAVIWISTGVSLILGGHVSSPFEYNAALFIVGMGVFVAFMDFYHVWPKEIAFKVSSSTIIYLVAYVTVVVVRTDLEVTDTTLKASLMFILLATIGFKIIKKVEPPKRTGFDF